MRCWAGGLIHTYAQTGVVGQALNDRPYKTFNPHLSSRT